MIFDFHIAGGGDGFEGCAGPRAHLQFDLRRDEGDEVVGVGFIADSAGDGGAGLCYQDGSLDADVMGFGVGTVVAVEVAGQEEVCAARVEHVDG